MDRTNNNIYGSNNAMQNNAFHQNINKGLKENEKLRAKDEKYIMQQEKKNAQ